MKTIEATQAKSSLAAYARKARKEPVVFTAGGKPVAVLVGIRNADLETVSLCNHPKFISLIERSRASQKSQGGLSPGEMRALLKKL